MFDLITGNAAHIPRTAAVPMLVSAAAQMAVVGLLIAIPALYVTDQLPTVSTMMAFVAAAPPPSPPPPPPPPPAPARTIAAADPVPTTGTAAPVEAPSQVLPETAATAGGEEGIEGGIEGGIPGGIAGGFVGGFEIPPPPPPAARVPVRIGGQILQPALLHRVEPVYPDIAVAAHLEGTVILEAVVDEEGRVEHVRVLRSVKFLDSVAMDAVRQWRYRPLLLNDIASPFVLTVVLTFSLK